MGENRMAWHLWTLLSHHDRPSSMGGIMTIPTLNALHLCEAYNATFNDFEKVLLIEDIMLPRLRERAERDSKPKKVKGFE